MTAESPRALDGTEGAQDAPFWSPDSEMIGFGTDTDLKVTSVAGGRTLIICRLPGSFWRGGSWGPSGDTIAFSAGAGFSALYKVSSRGGEPEPVLDLGSGYVSYPSFLPLQSSPQKLLFSAGGIELGLLDLGTGETEILSEGREPIYSTSGHILFTRTGSQSLWALPFSLNQLKTTGEAFLVAQGVSGASVADDGTLVVTDPSDVRPKRLVVVNRDGTALGNVGEPQDVIRWVDLSPDESQVAVEGREAGEVDIWLHDMNQALKHRLTIRQGFESFPVWSSTGEDVAFTVRQGLSYDIFTLAKTGDGEPQELIATEKRELPEDWSPDGKHLLYVVREPETGRDLWRLTWAEDGSKESHPYIQTPHNERGAKFSPDGRYVAYTGDDSGINNVYVQSFPKAGQPKQVSVNGGVQPRWSEDGRELFYVQGGKLMATPVSVDPTFSIRGQSKPLFNILDELGGMLAPVYDVTSDGRFVTVDYVKGEGELPKATIHVTENWYEEFRHRETGP